MFQLIKNLNPRICPSSTPPSTSPPSVELEGPNPLATADPTDPLNSLQLIHLYVFNYISGAGEQVDSKLLASAWKTLSPCDLNIKLKKREGERDGRVDVYRGVKTKQNKKIGHVSI